MQQLLLKTSPFPEKMTITAVNTIPATDVSTFVEGFIFYDFSSSLNVTTTDFNRSFCFTFMKSLSAKISDLCRLDHGDLYLMPNAPPSIIHRTCHCCVAVADILHISTEIRNSCLQGQTVWLLFFLCMYKAQVQNKTVFDHVM